MEEKGDYLTDASEMLGKGYEHPAVQIEAPRAVIERRNGRNYEVEHPAFVKISTAFKAEMGEIDEIALKVWMYIALSINRKTGTANPGVRTIAKDCRLDKDTVARAVKRLEEKYGLLIIDRATKKYNIYQPIAYVSANKTVPTAGTVYNESVPTEGESVPTEGESVPTRGGLNQSNQSNQSNARTKRKVAKKGDGVDAMLLTPETQAEMLRITDILHDFERALKRSDDLAGNESWRSLVKSFVIPQMDTKNHPYADYLEWYASDSKRMEWAWKEEPDNIRRRWLMAWTEQTLLPGIEVVPASEAQTPTPPPTPIYVPNPRLKKKNLETFQRLEAQA